MKKLILLILLNSVVNISSNAQNIEWATALNFDSEISNKDGYRARLTLGPPDVLKYGEWGKNAAEINLDKPAKLWLEYTGETLTKQILILESSGAGSILSVDIVDAVTGKAIKVYENSIIQVDANYRLTRIVFSELNIKVKQIKLKLIAKKQHQQIDAVGITDSDESFTIESFLSKHCVVKPSFNNYGNDASLNNIVYQYTAKTGDELQTNSSSGIVAKANSDPQIAPIFENLGSNVNSVYSELSPLIAPDAQKIFFIRADHPENTEIGATQDIWYSKIDENGNWTLAKHLGKPFNKVAINSIEGFSPDGNIRFIKGYYKNGERTKLGISQCNLTADGWSEPEGIEINKFNKMFQGKYLSFYMHPDNKTLVMSFSEKGGDENSDLYVSFKTDANEFSQPLFISALNTLGDENGPFLAADGVTLYWSSNRIGGQGNNDIWMSKRLDETWQNWSTPLNLGASINTNEWESGYCLPASGDYAYMVTQKNSIGKSDVVRIKLKEEFKPNPVVLIKGKVLDKKTNLPVLANISYVTLIDGKEIGITQSHPQTGDYQIILPYGKLYGFKASARSYYSVSDNIDVSDLKKYEEINRDLYLVPIEVGQVVRLNNIFFEFGKAVLKPESFIEIDNVVKFMNENTELEIALGGHTDNVGSDDYNLKLSTERSKAILDYIVSKGILITRLSTQGYGKTRPLADNNTEEGKALNRRVEFTILKK